MRRAFEHEFEKGELSRLTELTSAEAHRERVLDLAVLAQVLTGELAKALWHWRWIEEKGVKLTDAESAAIRFALGLGHTRVSEYAKARRYFAGNRRLKSSSLRAAFFFYQGLGFYRFFTSSYGKSILYAEKALERATQDKFRFGQLLAEELLGHSLLESGQIRRGMFHLRRSLKRARDLENKSLSQSFRLNLLLNEARFGLDFDCLPKLEKALKKLHPHDTYSRNAVKLELANQWTLRGRTQEAYEVLDEACDSVYASQNRRQIAQLNFRLAFLTWLRGGQDEALHLLKSAEMQLHKEVDHALWMKMRGLQSRILKRPPGEARGRERLIGVHARIVARAAGREAVSSIGEDRLGDLYDEVHGRDGRALETVLANGLHYLLYDYFGLEFNQKALVFDLLPKGLLIIDRGNITVVDQGVTRVLRRILEALAVSHQSKEELIRNVWGYTYESERHDPLVYTSISKLRQMLGRAGAWVEVDEKGYRLQSGVRLSGLKNPAPGPDPRKAINIIATSTNSSLSFRQLRILASFDTDNREAIGIEDVMRAFAVSRATATRDLTRLTDEGYLRRLGKARATRYLLLRRNS